MTRLEILLADDHAMIRSGLRNIIDDTTDLCVAGEASNGTAVLAQIKRLRTRAAIEKIGLGRKRVVEMQQVKLHRWMHPVAGGLLLTC